jgi:hypothetical protein
MRGVVNELVKRRKPEEQQVVKCGLWHSNGKFPIICKLRMNLGRLLKLKLCNH